MGTVRCLKCRECNREYEPDFRYICEDCFGPIDVEYEIPSVLTRELFSNRQEKSYWRYFELLPIANKNNIISLGAGFTPLQLADRLGEQIGNLKNIFIKNDSVNPTYSFKDRPAGVAVSKAKEIRLRAVGCASTGNLASATAAACLPRLSCHALFLHPLILRE